MGKPRRPPDPPANVAQRHLTLGLALLRADAMAVLVGSASKDIPRGKRKQAAALVREITQVKLGPVGKWMSYLQLYFASVQVLIETLGRVKITSPAIERHLAHGGNRKLLAEFRHDLLHGASPLAEGIDRLFSNLTEVDQWAYELRLACDETVVSYFEKPAVKAGMERFRLN